QMLLSLGAEKGERLGAAGLVVLSVLWIIGAAADHAGDLLRPAWRSGFPSKALVVGIVAVQVLTALLAARDLRHSRTAHD
ncbi:MAG: hypothetical protein ABR573_04275, partial [Candidatus Dormibacteria bacterium]